MVACLQGSAPFLWADPWNDTIVADILGCRAMGGAFDAENGSFEDVGSDGSARTLRLHCLGPGACSATATVTTQTVSEGETVLFIVLGILTLGLVLRILSGQMDRARIRGFVEEHGGRVLAIRWQPFGRGWFGERGERIYEVRLVGRDGQPREARFKTSLWTGVWTDQMT